MRDIRMDGVWADDDENTWRIGYVNRFDEYQLICADGNVHHVLDRPTVRNVALAALEYYNNPEKHQGGCGPHLLRQRHTARISSYWGPLLDSDWQVRQLEQFRELCQTKPCPKCHVEANQPCVDLRPDFPGRLVKYPHYERVELVQTRPEGTP